MKLNHLRDVVAISERGSVRAAARQLKITQPALTRSIHELERDLGAPLFERRAKGVIATEIGERFIRRAQAILSELGHARDEIRQLHGVKQGRVTVCLGVLPHLVLLPQALTAFRQRYPDVQLDIVEGRFPTSEASLKAGIVDFFVGPQHAPVGKDLVMEKLYDQGVAIHCRKGHPLATARSLRDLVHAEWLSNAVTIDMESEIHPMFARYGLPAPRLVVRSHTALTSLVTLAATDLLMLVPADMASTILGRPLLSRIEVAEELHRQPIVMIRRAGLPLTPAAEYFADMIRRASVQHAQKSEREAPRITAPSASSPSRPRRRSSRR